VSVTGSRRRKILADLAAGNLDIIVGTHALFEPAVRFARLALVIIDEQQRFGVVQRASLRNKGRAPHTLVLSATPIPRTLAMAMFGDLDVSTMTGSPPGRQPVITRVVGGTTEAEAWRFVRSRLDQGEQAYVIYPLVEESEDLPLRAATQEIERLSQRELKGHTAALLHGRMSEKDKAAVMARFRSGKVQVLISTTVIEVGVDVPNATIMAVQNAEHFGLSQLHQLRGRVGRGTRKSYCLLCTESANPETLERLRFLCTTSDGFRIAEEDLKRRGPGELLGTRQHGVPLFRVADPIRDSDLLTAARADAAAILASDAALECPEHAALRRALAACFGGEKQLLEAMSLPSVG